MRNEPKNISARTYELLHAAFDHFNDRLFAGELPAAVLVLHRKRGAHGYFHGGQWKLRDGDDSYAEIALNPHSMGRSPAEVLSTLAHEMAHLWDHLFGKVPASGHGKTWAAKMDEIGLTPTSTGQPGGKRTGRKVTHMIVDGGPFANACELFLTEHPDAISVFAVPAAPAAERKKDLSKLKHSCPCCNANVWGKAGIRVICGDCDEIMLPEGGEGEDE